MTDGHTLRIERTFQAPAEAVFAAWTSAEVLRRWWQTEQLCETTEAEVDVRVGGTLRVTMRDPRTGEEHGGEGRFTEVERPHRLAFTWLWDGDTRRTLIEVDFAESDGATLVRFVHRQLWDEAAVRDHEKGWREILERLEREVAG